MTALNDWLNEATRCLSRESATQVQAEIREHFESAREDAIGGGAAGLAADESALAALGDPRIANRQYRRVLVTSGDARVLREGNWEARSISKRPGLKWQLLAVPVAAFCGSARFFMTGETAPARVSLAAGILSTFLLAALFLPVYTPARSRIFRVAKWVLMAVALGMAFWPFEREWFWLLPTSLWPLVWIEWTRASIRRKLRVAEWPKHLYL